MIFKNKRLSYNAIVKVPLAVAIPYRCDFAFFFLRDERVLLWELVFRFS